MKIAVCAPTFGRGPEFCHPTPIHEIARELGNMTPFTGGTSPHDRSRGLIQARALQTDAEAFLWIDDDIRATREQCYALAERFRDLVQEGFKTLTGLYVCRHLVQQGIAALNVSFLPPEVGDLDIEFGPDGGLFKVTSHGFGFCIVSRDCLNELDAKPCRYEGIEAKAWWLPEVVEGEHLGEDRSFTWRVLRDHLNLDEAKPWPMMVDTRLCVDHAGFRVQS